MNTLYKEVLRIGAPMVLRLADCRTTRRISRPHKAIGGIAGHHSIPAVVCLSLFLSNVAFAQQDPDAEPANASDARVELDTGEGYSRAQDTVVPGGGE